MKLYEEDMQKEDYVVIAFVVILVIMVVYAAFLTSLSAIAAEPGMATMNPCLRYVSLPDAQCHATETAEAIPWWRKLGH